ncbi:NAD-dependent epimerase/dehydratase family protein [Paenirhodobacter populi]|uniref:NAD-dependent epimerase/dehydratase family protein n=1 Tax=Paenirhodobacter populi TaxID=2306993 RepID=A0A443IKY8_9RHOB|nr:NAD-dependent epimerase/dehydratase family protein [Sinirhodobacter populi]RWR05764.1 NAD-dependent epimerase/dehydratase family protein [Sinirhodobacter populi]
MKIFVTGASGFIGGSVAAQAVRRGHEVRGLVRSPEKAQACAAFGIVPVHGILADHELLVAEASVADAVINAASSDDRPAIDALLGALANSGKTLIHTSGSSIVADDAVGNASDAVFDEDHLPQPTADKAARVALDRAVLTAVGMRSIVLCNSLVFGDSLGPPARSVQLPLLIDFARETGRAAYIGSGLNRWSTVHIADVADLYLLALETAAAGTFAFVESGEAAFLDMARSIADALAIGEPISLSMEAAEERWGKSRARYSLASNSRVRGLRAAELGWAPTLTSVHEWIADHLSDAR